jgi:DNA/RNA-binding protein KIN17
MGKGEAKQGFMTPKAISNRIKVTLAVEMHTALVSLTLSSQSKGLQKLRWFCQMCQKQCRDENGFKCHCESESHKRQMLIFAQNSGKILDSFSTEVGVILFWWTNSFGVSPAHAYQFEEGFMDILSRRHGTKRMHCNVVYQEYINDKVHTHMNSTKWESLSSFVQHLGRTGKATIDETEKVSLDIKCVIANMITLLRQDINTHVVAYLCVTGVVYDLHR